MDVITQFVQRNAEFAEHGFHQELKIIPSLKTLIIGCVDPRVDPMDILKLQPGEAAIIRNVGGRVNPSLFETLKILSTVSKAGGVEVDKDWNLVVLQHTQCGINGCYHNAPELLAPYMGVPLEQLDTKAITDPYKAVAIDVDALRSHPVVGKNFTISGLVYDVATGLIETVVPPAA
jgi:carbonic anhydrase